MWGWRKAGAGWRNESQLLMVDWKVGGGGGSDNWRVVLQTILRDGKVGTGGNGFICMLRYGESSHPILKVTLGYRSISANEDGHRKGLNDVKCLKAEICTGDLNEQDGRAHGANFRIVKSLDDNGVR